MAHRPGKHGVAEPRRSRGLSNLAATKGAPIRSGPKPRSTDEVGV